MIIYYHVAVVLVWLNTVVKQNTLLISDLDEIEELDDLVELGDLDFSSAGVIFTVHAALGCPFFPHR